MPVSQRVFERSRRARSERSLSEAIPPKQIMINSHIELTLLKLGIMNAEVETLCQAAIAHQLKGVCVPPAFVSMASKLLEGTEVRCVSVVGFPHGMHLTGTKIMETVTLMDTGAQELDLVANLSMLRNGDLKKLSEEITLFQTMCGSKNIVSKVIIESGLLSFEEVKTICEICREAGVNFVKTSTGYAGVGAEIEKVAYIRSLLPDRMGIKASGGIRDLATAKAFIDAGASRIGTSTLITEL